MNKRKLEKSQRDHKFKRRRSIRIRRNKFYDLIKKMNSEELERILTYARKIQQQSTAAAKIIQKNFREYMVKKNN